VTAKTGIELYREGNSSTPRFDELTPKDVTVYWAAGAGYVRAGQGEGISTLEAIPKPKGKWWVLPKDSEYDDSALKLVPDLPGHWQWEPRWDMSVDTYRAALTDVQVKFKPTWTTVPPTGAGKGRSP
jgi:hypothetical protein